MNPVRLIKSFCLFLTFVFLAGFSFDAYAQQAYYVDYGKTGTLLACSTSTTGGSYCYLGIVPLGRYFSSHSALCAALPYQVMNRSTQEVMDGTFTCSGHYELRAPSRYMRYNIRVINNHSGDYDDDCSLSPDSPYCLNNPDPEPEDPDPDPDPEEGDFCDVYPESEYCQPGFEPPEYCDSGVGSPACCHAYAYNDCRAKGSVLDNVFYRDFDNSCSWSCGSTPPPESNNPFPSPDPTPTPAPVNPSPSDPVNPSLPGTPEDPNDPNNPVSVDVSGVNERLGILIDLTAEAANITNQNIDELDYNTQTSLENVRRSVDTGFGNLTRIFDPSGAQYFNPGSFPSGGITSGEAEELKALLGVTGDESYSDLEHSFDLYDYSNDYTFTLPDATCPAPLLIDLSFGSFELSYEPLCEIFEFLGSLVYLTALFLVPIIVFRGSQ